MVKNTKVSLKHKRIKIAEKIKENLLLTERNNLIDMQLELLKRQYANLLEQEEDID